MPGRFHFCWNCSSFKKLIVKKIFINTAVFLKSCISTNRRVIKMTSFTMVGNDIFEANVSDGALRLYMVLSSYCFGDKSTCFPSQNTLAARLNKSVRTIQRYIGELISCRLITKRRRGSISNEYEIVAKTIKENAAKIKNFFKGKSNNQNYAKSSDKPQTFSAYSQRNYDFQKLENMLLGNDRRFSPDDCLLK